MAELYFTFSPVSYGTVCGNASGYRCPVGQLLFVDDNGNSYSNVLSLCYAAHFDETFVYGDWVLGSGTITDGYEICSVKPGDGVVGEYYQIYDNQDLTIGSSSAYTLTFSGGGFTLVRRGISGSQSFSSYCLGVDSAYASGTGGMGVFGASTTRTLSIGDVLSALSLSTQYKIMVDDEDVQGIIIFDYTRVYDGSSHRLRLMKTEDTPVDENSEWEEVRSVRWIFYNNNIAQVTRYSSFANNTWVNPASFTDACSYDLVTASIYNGSDYSVKSELNSFVISPRSVTITIL